MVIRNRPAQLLVGSALLLIGVALGVFIVAPQLPKPQPASESRQEVSSTPSSRFQRLIVQTDHNKVLSISALYTGATGHLSAQQVAVTEEVVDGVFAVNKFKDCNKETPSNAWPRITQRWTCANDGQFRVVPMIVEIERLFGNRFKVMIGRSPLTKEERQKLIEILEKIERSELGPVQSFTSTVITSPGDELTLYVTLIPN